MILQINYDTNRYDDYLKYNQTVLRTGRIIFNKEMVEGFIRNYGYEDAWNRLKVKEQCKHAEVAIKLDAFRLMLLYELGGIYIDADVKFTDKINTLQQDLFKKFGDRNIICRTNSLFFIRGVPDSRFIEHLLWRYLSAEQLGYDVDMLRGWKLSEFATEVAIIEPEFLTPYFTHDKVTTK